MINNKLDEKLMKYFFSEKNFNIVSNVIKQNIDTKYSNNINSLKDYNLDNEIKKAFLNVYKENIKNLNLIFNEIDKIKFLNKELTKKVFGNVKNIINNEKKIKNDKNIKIINIKNRTKEKVKNKFKKEEIEEFVSSSPKIINKEIIKNKKANEKILEEENEIGNEKLQEIISYPKINPKLLSKLNFNETTRHIITIDSFLKDWRGKWTKTFDSNKRFKSISLSKEKNYRYNYTINFTNSFDTSGIKINRILKNITKIKILRLILPNNENISQDFKTTVKNTKMESYLIVNINELSNNNNITNTNIENDFTLNNEWNITKNSIFTRLYPSSSFSTSGILNNNNETVFLREKNVFVNRDNEEYTNKIATLNKLNISILKPGGYIYNNFKDDYFINGIDIYFKNVFFNRNKYDNNFVLNNTIAVNKRIYRDYYFVLHLKEAVHKEWFKQFDEILININFRDFLPKSNKLNDNQIYDLENWFNTDKHTVIDSYLEDNMKQGYVYIRLDSNNTLNIGDKLVLGETAFVIEAQDTMIVPGELVFRMGEKYDDNTKLSVYETSINIINAINDPTNGLFYHASLYDVVKYDYDSFLVINSSYTFVSGDVIMGLTSKAVGTVINQVSVTEDYETKTKLFYTKNFGTFEKDETILNKLAEIINVDNELSILTIKIHSSFSFTPLENDFIVGYTSNASGKVISYNSINKEIKYLKIKGTFILNEMISISSKCKKAVINERPLEKNNNFAWIKITANSIVGNSSEINKRKIRYMKKTGQNDKGEDTFELSDEIKFFKEPYLDDKYSYSFDNAIFTGAQENNLIYGNNYVNRIIINGPNNINQNNGLYYGNDSENKYAFLRIENDTNAYDSNNKHLINLDKWNFKNYLKYMTNKNTTLGTLINYNLQHTIVLEVETRSNKADNQ